VREVIWGRLSIENDSGRATSTVLQILFSKYYYLPTPKTIWRENKKGISKCLAILTWKKNLLVPKINEEASGCLLELLGINT